MTVWPVLTLLLSHMRVVLWWCVCVSVSVCLHARVSVCVCGCGCVCVCVAVWLCVHCPGLVRLSMALDRAANSTRAMWGVMEAQKAERRRIRRELEEAADPRLYRRRLRIVRVCIAASGVVVVSPV